MSGTKMIGCSLCGVSHPPIHEGSQVGYGCAAVADVFDGHVVLQGYYGSTTIDMERWILKGDRSISDRAIVCDSCIDLMQVRGDITFLESVEWVPSPLPAGEFVEVSGTTI